MRPYFLSILALICFSLSCSPPPSKSPSNNDNNGNNQNGMTNGGTNGETNGGTNGATNSSGGPFIDPDDYDQTCEWDSECALASGGDVCGCGMVCPGAISTEAVEQFNADVEAVDCTNVEPGPCPGAACQQMMAVCSSGDCEAIPVVEIDPSQFDQSCVEDEDCMLITSGQLCSDCDCARAGINVADAEKYEELVGDVDCNPGPQTCDCAPPTQAHCNAEGMCVVGPGT